MKKLGHLLEVPVRLVGTAVTEPCAQLVHLSIRVEAEPVPVDEGANGHGVSPIPIRNTRHSFATRALALGECLPMIDRMLGHSEVKKTARYAHPARDSVHEAGERHLIQLSITAGCPVV